MPHALGHKPRLITVAFLVVTLAAIVQRSPVAQFGLQTAFGVARVGEWRVLCSDFEGCRARLALASGQSPQEQANGSNGAIDLVAGIDKAGGAYFKATYGDQAVATWDGAAIRSVSVDGGRPHALTCDAESCRVSDPSTFIAEAERGARLTLDLEGRAPVVIDISDFKRAWSRLESKAGNG